MRTEKAECIGFVVGIPGHLPQVTAVAREFGLPVSVIVMSERMEDAVRRAGIGARLHSFPAFYRAHRQVVDELAMSDVRTRIADFEAAWNLGSTATLLRIERSLPRNSSYESALRLALLYYLFVDHLLDSENFLWVKANITTLFGLAFQQACVKRGIPCLKQQSARVDGRVEFMDETSIGMLRGWKALYEALVVDENAVPAGVRNAADAWLRRFCTTPQRPAYAQKNSRLSFSLRRVAARLIESLLVRFDRNYWRALSKYSLDRQLGIEAPRGQGFFQDFLIPEWRRLWLPRLPLFARSPARDEPYLYLPLQFHPEISTLTYAIRYEDQKHFVEELSKAVPNGWRLYVKEHTSMIGRRSARFYRDLAKLHNVVLVHPAVSTFDLMRDARAVVSITSTAGWEAFIFGKPVVVFGNVFYEQCPGVLKLNFTDDTADAIRRYVGTFAANPAAIRRAVIAYFGATYEGTTGDIGKDTSASDAERNAAVFAAAAREQLERFPMSRLSRPPLPPQGLDSEPRQLLRSNQR